MHKLFYCMPRIIRKNDSVKKVLSLKDFNDKKNKILILRETGGLGDILMHWQMFEDFKSDMPDAVSFKVF